MRSGADLPPLHHARTAYLLAFAMLVMVVVLSLVPAPQLVAGSDKLIHFVVYLGLSAGFSILVCRNRSLYLVGAGLIVYGISIEWLQGLTGYRYFEYQDILANSAGVLVGLLIRMSPIPLWVRQLEQRWLV